MEGGENAQSHGSVKRRHLSWFLFARLSIVTLFLGGTILYQLRSGLEVVPPAVPYLYLLAGVYYLQALLIAVFLRQLRKPILIIHAQIVWDLLFFSGLIYLTGGIESIFSFTYVLSIVGSGFLVGRKETLVVASASAILYGSILDLQYYGYLPVVGEIPFLIARDGTDVFYAVFIHVVAFLLVGALSGAFADSLKKSERALERREIDFEELENLNRTILANISSGLMIINPLGKIRSFNAAASRITGYSLEDVYDHSINDYFQHLQLYDGTLKVVPRGEGLFIDPRGDVRNLGFGSTFVKDLVGRTLGLLVTFQDLTHLKEMEHRLKRADRLAAVGRLASGMAHEIRNPLASISGSVQLIMESGDPTPEDRRLMEIVVREADRLSNLLTDFLVFANPKSPNRELTDISALLDELGQILMGDPRFTGIEVRLVYGRKILMPIDRGQLQQAVLNLLINAADAMPNGGVMEVDVDPGQRIISVDDSGPGVSNNILDKIFDPFFTTKAHGTGLGLATVYAIVEGHGGEVHVSSGPLGGARFLIRLPKVEE